MIKVNDRVVLTVKQDPTILYGDAMPPIKGSTGTVAEIEDYNGMVMLGICWDNYTNPNNETGLFWVCRGEVKLL